MSITDWLMGLLSSRRRALVLYRRGMAKAKKDDFAGAISDYSVALQTAGMPRDVKAMTLYNRALAYSALNEDEKAGEDLAAVLAMPGLPESIKTEAARRRERIRRRGRAAGNG